MTKLGTTTLLKTKEFEFKTMRKSVSRQLRCVSSFSRSDVERCTPLGWADTDAARGGGPLLEVFLMYIENEVFWFLDLSRTLTKLNEDKQVVWLPTMTLLEQILIV